MSVQVVVTHRAHPGPSPLLRRSLVAVELFAGLNAVVGGVGLIVHGLGIPREQLEGTPFDSFLLPGLLLAGAVGGSMLGAALAVLRYHPLGGLASVGEGSVMLGWIIIESLMIREGRVLQGIIAAMAVATLLLGAMLFRHERRMAC